MSHAVLELIWHSEGISRAGIARATGLARSTVSDLTADLLDSGLVVESGDAPSEGGRRAVMLSFDARSRVVLGVDLGASHVGVVLTDMRGETLEWRVEPCPVRDDPDGATELVERLSLEALATEHGRSARLLGLGVGLPAPIDDSSPRAPAPSVLPAWDGHTGLQDLADRLDVPIEVENDANLGALAELWWGGSEGIRDFTFIKVATGIGAGHIVKGEIFRGATGVAGEIGHVTIDPAGERCVCGNRGCLTTLVGTEALLSEVRRRVAEYPSSSLAGGEPTLRRLVEASLNRDPLAVEVVARAGRHLGDAISGLVNLMNPAEVVLGGGITQVGDLLLDPIREEVARRTLVASVLSTQIRRGTLEERDVALGAATLVISSALDAPTRYFSELSVA
jgi:predicted NBD/HSP70 family sugar kinase